MKEEPSSRVDEVTRKRDVASGLPLTNDACLVVIYGFELARRYPLLASSISVRIGRDRDSDIMLDLPDVSRHHAEVRLMRDRWFVTDLLSTNGTEVNGRRIEGETILANGDLVNVGGVIFKYIAGGNLESLFHEEVYRMTVYDGLTRLPNKRFFGEFALREMARAARHKRPLSLGMLDVDHFKAVNDAHGHLAGDHLLAAIAEVLASNVRSDELVARYGGEEFAIVLPESDLAMAVEYCDALRERISGELFFVGAEPLPATVSIGVAQYRPGSEVDEWIQAADEQLYAAKREGRNRVAGQ